MSDPVPIDGDGDDDHQTLDDVLPDVGHADEDQAVRQDGDDQRTDQRTPYGADTADEARATENDGGDRVNSDNRAPPAPTSALSLDVTNPERSIGQAASPSKATAWYENYSTKRPTRS